MLWKNQTRRKCSLSILAACLLLTMLPSSLGFQRALPTTTTPTKLPGSTVLSRHFARDSIASTKTNSKTSRSSSKKTTTALSAVTASSVVTSLLSSPLGSISLLAGIVLIHEAGHYLAARSFGIEVEEFSVGVGPKLWGFTASNGNEFNLRALPLGGYVRFPENYNATLVQDLQQQAVEQAKQERDERKRKAAAAAAAAAARRGGIGTQFWNALSLGAVQQRQQKLKEEQEKQRAADAAAVSKPWWKFGANQKASNIEQGDDDDDDDEEELEVPPVEIPYDENPNLLQNRPWTERAVVLSGGVIFNLLLAFSIYFGQIVAGPGIPSPVFEPGVVVSSIPRPQAASEGLLRKGDVILDVNGRPLTQSASPTVFESQRAINDLIATIRSTPSGEDIKLTVLRGSNDNPQEIVRIKPKPMNGGKTGAPSIGVLLTPNYVKSAVLKSNNPVQAARMAADYTLTLTKETAGGLLRFITQAFQSSGGGASAGVSGPIGLIKTGSDVVATKDLTAVLLFAAAISINLGVVNALPLPALDGGQLLFVLAEAVTGRKVDQRLQEGITGVAVFVLLLITIGAAVGDISSIMVGQ